MQPLLQIAKKDDSAYRTTSPMAAFSSTDFELLRRLRLKLEEVDDPNGHTLPNPWQPFMSFIARFMSRSPVWVLH
jgi:hypothetical protein